MDWWGEMQGVSHVPSGSKGSNPKQFKPPTKGNTKMVPPCPTHPTNNKTNVSQKNIQQVGKQVGKGLLEFVLFSPKSVPRKHACVKCVVRWDQAMNPAEMSAKGCRKANLSWQRPGPYLRSMPDGYTYWVGFCPSHWLPIRALKIRPRTRRVPLYNSGS